MKGKKDPAQIRLLRRVPEGWFASSESVENEKKGRKEKVAKQELKR